MSLNRVHARRIGFILVVLAGIWFELSSWGARTADAMRDLQHAALDRWRPNTVADAAGSTLVDAGAHSPPQELRPLSSVMAMSLVVISALVWWESRLLGWAVASSLVALVALFAVSTMMLARGVLVPLAGPGLAIIFAMFGRRALEAAIVFRDRSARRQDRSCQRRGNLGS